MPKFEIKNGSCHELIFRRWRLAKDGITKIFPKTAKAFPFWIDVDCHFCDCCKS